jgi:oxygen-independent coproporphyrinogen III oxidase
VITLPTQTLERFDIAGPRYTSYPTADRFYEGFGPEDFRLALQQRQAGHMALPVSVYVHIPFCESLCYYCACNKIITKHHSRAHAYLDALEREADLVGAALGQRPRTTQIHFGGGTPTFLTNDEFDRLWQIVTRHVEPVPGGEFTVEVDPRTVTVERLQFLFQRGLNRLSFGVQDLAPEVQRAVHRIQSESEIFELVAAARAIGFESINVDLIYGLPKQTAESFKRTIQTIARLRPDRIALYSYAHLPHRFKAQRRIHEADLPGASTKLAMLAATVTGLQEAGYEYIAMDHFALPNDALAIAKKHGSLHRNFQGYSTQADSDLIGLGVSAISKVGQVYAQNAKTIEEYEDSLNHQELPTVRGFALQRDDVLRRAVIMALMCQGVVEFESIETAFLVNFQSVFARELQQLRSYEDLGWIQIDARRIKVTEAGWFFVRLIAMAFDRYLQADQERTRYSRVL